MLDYFEEVFDEASKFVNLKQTIVTNGLFITEGWAEKLVRSNVELVFSIDGVTKEVYEKIRVGAKFEDVLRRIKIVTEARKRAPGKIMSLRLHVVIMKSNYQELEEFIDFAKEYEFDAMHLIAIWGNPESEENIFHRKEGEALTYISALKDKIEEKAKRFNIELLNSLPDGKGTLEASIPEAKINAHAKGDELFCRLPWQQLNIDPGGGVRPGCLCLRTVGNILEESLLDVWNSTEMQTYRKKIINKEYVSWCNPGCLSGQISKGLRGL